MPKPDLRCMEHDHDFPFEELYDEEGNGLGERQFLARCRRCGITLAESCERLCADIVKELQRLENNQPTKGYVQ